MAPPRRNKYSGEKRVAMFPYISPPPVNPDIKRELKQQLLSLSARSFEFFAGEFLVYVGLESVSVTRYIGDGGIDALGSLVAGLFRIPVGIQVKRNRNNVQRPAYKPVMLKALFKLVDREGKVNIDALAKSNSFYSSCADIEW